ncbi:MAG: general secretion pathway protein GspE [Thermotoga sp.]|nr:MAG: general secretion pathway protein GspE [Thermotoga sp.]
MRENERGSLRYKRIGEILVDKGIITNEDLATAMNIQRSVKRPLGEVLVEYGYATWEQIAEALASQYNLPLLKEIPRNIDPDVIEMIPRSIVEKYRVIPFEKNDEKKEIKVVTDEVLNLGRIIQEIRFTTGYNPIVYLTSRDNFETAYTDFYERKIGKEIVEELRIAETEIKEEDLTLEAEETEEVETAPIVRLVNSLIDGAIRDQASDIHIEPFEKEVVVRYRVDGVLRRIMSYPKHSHSGVVSRVKILSNLDISERRLPQDGKFYVRIDDEQYDLRVSTMPTIYGEKVVMRILQVSASKKRIEDLGFSEYNKKRLEQLIQHPYGIILVTGPTGSGKSTTLVAIINELKDVTNNIITIEDPVEYSIEGVNQCQVNPEIGLTFARMLRSVLRQDPDIIMVGEIRDRETAQLAIEASMTGHLVLSTLHTNNAPSAISRLVNLGVDPYLISTSLLGVLSQRLVRTLCNDCKEKVELREELVEMANTLYPDLERTEYRAVGCRSCKMSGYRGRTVISEVMIIDDEIRSMIVQGASEMELERIARKRGMRTMFEDGMEKVLKGITTVEEVKRVASLD